MRKKDKEETFWVVYLQKSFFKLYLYDLQKLQLPDDGHVNAFCLNVADFIEPIKFIKICVN